MVGIKVQAKGEGQEEDLNFALILVISPVEPAPLDRALGMEGDEPHSLMVRLDGAGETLCACGKPEGVSWYWLKLDLLDSVPSPCGEMTSGSQLFARSNIFRIMGTIDREMVFDRLCDRPRVAESVARCCSTSWK